MINSVSFKKGPAIGLSIIRNSPLHQFFILSFSGCISQGWKKSCAANNSFHLQERDRGADQSGAESAQEYIIRAQPFIEYPLHRRVHFFLLMTQMRKSSRPGSNFVSQPVFLLSAAFGFPFFSSLSKEVFRLVLCGGNSIRCRGSLFFSALAKGFFHLSSNQKFICCGCRD
jgi:hypothetical protein